MNYAKYILSRSKKSARLAALFIFPVCFLFFSSHAWALPEGENVTAGTAVFDRSQANTLTVNVSTDRMIANYNSFSIAGAETVNFNQPSSSSIALNRVVGISPSSLMGRLTSNGGIFLVNPNGIVFGPSSVVDTAGLIASTLDISDNDFLNGNYNFFRNGGSAYILNQGNIIIRNGGYVGLLSQGIENQGIIQAELGTVVLASGEKMTLAMDDSADISVVIDDGVRDFVFGPDGEKIDSAIKNSGTISANGGKVLLTAKVLNNVFDYAINNSGIIEAASLTNHNGVVELFAQGADVINTNTGVIEASTIKAEVLEADFINDGEIKAEDTVSVEVVQGNFENTGIIAAENVNIEVEEGDFVNKGEIAADGSIELPNGGRIIITATTILHQGVISANAFEGGTAGEIEIISQASTVLDEGSQTQALALGIIGNGGRITVNSLGGNTVVNKNAVIDVSAGSIAGNAGFIEVSAFDQLGFYGILNGRAPPGYTGANAFLEAAQGSITLSSDSILSANSLTLISKQGIFSDGVLLVDDTLTLLSDGPITSLGILRAKILVERGASFGVGGVFAVEHANVQNLDNAITYVIDTTIGTGSGDIAINDPGNIIINANVIITLDTNGTVTFRADSDTNGTGAFIMNSGSSIVVALGKTPSLTIKASQAATLYSITGIATLTIEESHGNIIFQDLLTGIHNLILSANGTGDITFNDVVTIDTLQINTAEDVNFNANVTTVGDITQVAGIGTTTINNGFVDAGGNISITTGTIAFQNTGRMRSSNGLGAVTLIAQTGGITSGTAASDVTAATLVVTAATGIGINFNESGQPYDVPLKTQVSYLQATNTTSGNINITNTDTLILTSFGEDTDSGGGYYSVLNDAPGGSVSITTLGDEADILGRHVEIGDVAYGIEMVQAKGNINLVAGGNIILGSEAGGEQADEWTDISRIGEEDYDIILQAGKDIKMVNDVNTWNWIYNEGDGKISLDAGGDVYVGTIGFYIDNPAANSGTVTITAGGSIFDDSSATMKIMEDFDGDSDPDSPTLIKANYITLTADNGSIGVFNEDSWPDFDKMFAPMLDVNLGTGILEANAPNGNIYINDYKPAGIDYTSARYDLNCKAPFDTPPYSYNEIIFCNLAEEGDITILEDESDSSIPLTLSDNQHFAAMGDIAINSPVTSSAGALGFHAYGDLTVSSNITLNGSSCYYSDDGELELPWMDLEADIDGNGSGNVNIGAEVTVEISEGGEIWIYARDISIATNAVIDAKGDGTNSGTEIEIVPSVASEDIYIGVSNPPDEFILDLATFATFIADGVYIGESWDDEDACTGDIRIGTLTLNLSRVGLLELQTRGRILNNDSSSSLLTVSDLVLGAWGLNYLDPENPILYDSAIGEDPQASDATGPLNINVDTLVSVQVGYPVDEDSWKHNSVYLNETNDIEVGEINADTFYLNAGGSILDDKKQQKWQEVEPDSWEEFDLLENPTKIENWFSGISRIGAENITLIAGGDIGSDSHFYPDNDDKDMDAGYLDISKWGSEGNLSITAEGIAPDTDGSIFLNFVNSYNELDERVGIFAPNDVTAVLAYSGNVYYDEDDGQWKIDKADYAGLHYGRYQEVDAGMEFNPDANLILASRGKLIVYSDIASSAYLGLYSTEDVEMRVDVDVIGSEVDIIADFYSEYLEPGADGSGGDDNGAIIQFGGAGTIKADNLILSAATGIGSDNPLETQVFYLQATNTTSGNINITNTGTLILTSFGEDTDSRGGYYSVLNDAPDGDITLSASETNDAGDDDLIINADILSAIGKIILQAGDDIIQEAGTTIQSLGEGKTITLNAGHPEYDLDGFGGIIQNVVLEKTDTQIVTNKGDITLFAQKDVKLTLLDATYSADGGMVSVTSMSGSIWDNDGGIAPDDYDIKGCEINLNPPDCINRTSPDEIDLLVFISVDTTSPTNFEFEDFTLSHAFEEWSNNNQVNISWTARTDPYTPEAPASGIAGYSYLWDKSQTTDPNPNTVLEDILSVTLTIEDGNDNWFHICAVDNAGNKSDVFHLGSFYIDTVAPTITVTHTPDANHGWNNEDVSVTFAAQDTLSGIDTITGDSPVVFTIEEASQQATYTATDMAGNTSSVIEVVSIDTTPPVITAGAAQGTEGLNGWWITDATVPFSATDDDSGSGFAPDGLFTKALDPKTTEGEGTGLTVTSDDVFDLAGNMAAGISSEAFKVDTTDPEITLALAGTEGLNDWYKQEDVDAGLTATDGTPDMPAPAIQYSLDGGGLVDYKGLVTLSDGIHSLYYQTVNEAGRTAEGTQEIKIDTEAPVITAGAPTGTEGLNGWWITDATVPFSAEDNLSGFDNGLTEILLASQTTTGEGDTLTVTSGGISDMAGNAADVVTTDPFKVDTTDPTIDIAVTTGTEGLNDWYVTAVSATLDADDDTPAMTLSSVEYSLDDGATWDDYDNKSFDVDEDGIYPIGYRVENEAGRIAEGTLQIKLDTTPPVITAGAAQGTEGLNGWWITDATVPFSATDDDSGSGFAPDGLFTKALDLKTTEGEGTGLTVTSDDVFDLAGNMAAGISSEAFKVDTTDPEIIVSRTPSANTNGWNNTAPVTVSFDVSDATSGVNFALTSVPPDTTYTGEIAGDSLSAVAYDNAGNMSTVTEVVSIDMTPPAVTVTAPDSGTHNNPKTLTYTVVDLNLLAVVGPASGTTYNAGSHNILITALDLAGNSGSAELSFTITPSQTVNALLVNNLTQAGLEDISLFIVNYKINSFNPTPTFYFYHPLTPINTSAFDDIILDVDDYEFIEDSLKSKKGMPSYYLTL